MCVIDADTLPRGSANQIINGSKNCVHQSHADGPINMTKCNWMYDGH